MRTATTTLIDRFISRYANPDEGYIASLAHLVPMVVITGGSSGIGKALATRFAQQGNNVVLVARSPKALKTAAHDIRTICPAARIETISCNITDKTAAERIKATVADFGGYIDIFINNAGIGLSGAFIEHDPNDVNALLAINITALTNLTHALLPDMLARARGGLINIGSLGGYVPGPQQAMYYASKSYVQSFTEAIAYENRGRGVRILASLPGPVGTTFHKEMGANNSPYRWLIPTMTAKGTAASVVRAYKLGRRISVPGVINTALAFALRVLPHPISLPIVNLLLQPSSTTRNS